MNIRQALEERFGTHLRLNDVEVDPDSIRVMPSYIITGGNLLIEKSKVRMIAEDIAAMAEIIRN